MNRCLETATLVALSEAVGWKDAEKSLRHVLACQECREQLQRLATLRDALNEEAVPAPGFTERVVRSVRLDRQLKPSPGRGPLLGLANALLAGVTAFFVVALAGSGGAAGSPAPAVLVVSLLAASATWGWNRLHRTPATAERWTMR